MADKTIKQLATEFTTVNADDYYIMQRDSDSVVGKVKASTAFGGGMAPLSVAPGTIANQGNNSYLLTFPGVNLTSIVSKGMRLRTTRTVTAPTQCADLEASSSHYFAKTSPAGTTFTDDFTCGGWVKLESYGTDTPIISRQSGTNGWALRINISGQVQIFGQASGAGRIASSYQSVPLGRWVHVAATLDMSGSLTTIYLDGVLVPSVIANIGAGSNTLTQAGNLEVGAAIGANFFDGKLAQVFVSSTIISAANIRLLSGQGLTSALCTTHSIVSAYSLSNAITDINTTTANNLTAQNSALATATDSPFSGGNVSEFTDGTTDWCIIVSDPVFSTDTTMYVQVPNGYTLPTSGGISAAYFSGQKIPYGFPGQRNKWQISSLQVADVDNGASTLDTWYNVGGFRLTIPIGSWVLNVKATVQNSSGAGAAKGVRMSINTTAASATGLLPQDSVTGSWGNSIAEVRAGCILFSEKELSVQTIYYVNIMPVQTNANNFYLLGGGGPAVFVAECAYL